MLMAKQYHEKLNSGDAGDSVSGGTPLIPGNASLLGWAISSLTKGKPSEHAPVASANTNSTVMSTPNAVAVHAGLSISAPDQPQPSSPTSTDGWGELENGDLLEDNDKEGWDDIDPIVEEHKPTPLSSIQAAQKRPIVQPQAQVMRPKSTVKAPKEEDDDDMWGAIAAPALKTAVKSLNAKPASSNSDDDLWGSIAAPSPKSASKPQKKAMANDDSDPWAAIAAPAPTTRAKPLSLGRGRGAKATPAKLGAQRIDRTTS